MSQDCTTLKVVPKEKQRPPSVLLSLLKTGAEHASVLSKYFPLKRPAPDRQSLNLIKNY